MRYLIGAMLGAALVCASPVSGQTLDREHDSAWIAGGGALTLQLYPNLLQGMDTLASGSDGVAPASALTFALQDGINLRFEAPQGLFARVTDGVLQTSAGMRLERRGQVVETELLRLRPADPSGQDIRVESSDGGEWFRIGPAHYLISPAADSLAVRSANLLWGADLAKALGVPEVAGEFIGRVKIAATIVRVGASRGGPTNCPGIQNQKWHGRPIPSLPGQTYQTDVLLESTSRLFTLACLFCDGPGGNNGDVKMAPDAFLRNSNTPTTADVPWYAKFVGQLGATPPVPQLPPYNNDQHPYLIYNVYRVDSNGRIRQIGVSALKHAYLTINTGCTLPPDCASNNILFRQCADVYAAESNDTPTDLGPRSEVIPSSGVWGRCGSIYDPDCDGQENPPGYGEFEHRMIISEDALDLTRNPGARYFAESFYVVRDDVNISNTMGWREFRPDWLSAANRWQATELGGFSNGPALESWVPLTASGNSQHVRVQTPEGEVRIAVRVRAVGNNFEYDYAVMNLDFSRAVTNGAEPNLRVIRNLGLSGFRVPVPMSTVSAVSMVDTDFVVFNDWTVPAEPELRFVAPAGRAQNWGTLHRYSFTSTLPPAPGTVLLDIAESGLPTQLSAAILVPRAPSLFADGFEPR